MNDRDLWWRLGWVESQYGTMLSQHGKLAAHDPSGIFSELRARASRSDSVLARILAEAGAAGPCPAHVVTRADSRYPEPLRQLSTAPYCLYGRGQLALLDAGTRRISIVGSRRARAGARRRTREIAADLAACDICIVSGLARGIDGDAHRGALDAGGTTIAVLPAGLSHVVPAQHRQLAQQIVEGGGLLLSPYPDDREPARWQFANRNTVVAALGEFLLVGQAAARSGTQHTVESALEMGIDVGIVPGGWEDAAYQASCRYLLEGAQPVVTAHHVLGSIGLATSHVMRDRPAPLDGCLATSRSLEELQHITGRSAIDLARELTRLEIAGEVVREPDGRYCPASVAGR